MKKRQVVLYIVVMLILLTTSVYATLQAELDFKATANDSVFCPGDEFIITIGLKNLTATQGIKSIEGYIDIDENILEDLTVSSIVTNDNGKVQIGTNNTLDVYDASNISSSIEKGIILNTNPVSERGDYKIVINLENPISSDTDLVDVKFKIKDSVSAGEYQSVMTYKLFNIFSTDAGEKLELPQTSYRLTVSNSRADGNVVNNLVNNTPTNNPTNAPTNNPTNNAPTNTPVNNATRPANNTVNNAASNRSVNNVVNRTTTNNTVNKVVNNTAKVVNKTGGTGGSGSGTSAGQKADGTTSPTNLPKTGYRIILIPILAVAIVGFVFYKKYSKYNSYHE